MKEAFEMSIFPLRAGKPRLDRTLDFQNDQSEYPES